jgi:4-alpha-glucanotransferase
VVPLFSLRTGSGWGLGEIADIGRFAAWASRAGFSVLQMLPVNEVSGVDASPYSALSAFALDPVYLSLDECEDFRAAGGRAALPTESRQKLEALAASPLVDWAQVRSLKKDGIELAFKRFLNEEWENQSPRARQLMAFMRVKRSWLDDYALFTVWHQRFGKSWLEWPHGARDRDPGSINAARSEYHEEILRAQWLQWQLDLQWRDARRAASAEGVALMGDLPFTVAADSADAWANRHLFRLDQHVGTPPDDQAPEGQDWGLPVYDWPALQRDEFSWIKGRAARAGELFSIYRVDHAIGFYRTYFRSVDGELSGFTPSEERAQLALGERIMRTMSRWAEVVAEDLGSMPPFLRPSLEKVGVPGYRVLRWEKDGDRYRDPATWPAASLATNATHDTDTTAAWYEALSPEDRERLREIPGLGTLDPKRPFDETIRDLFLRAVYSAPSTLSLVLFQDAMGTRERINTPGTVDPANWSLRISRTVDELMADSATTDRLAKLAHESGRVSVEKK